MACCNSPVLRLHSVVLGADHLLTGNTWAQCNMPLYRSSPPLLQGKSFFHSRHDTFDMFGLVWEPCSPLFALFLFVCFA